MCNKLLTIRKKAGWSQFSPQAGKRRLPACGGINIRGKNREF
jgi:hypothetical protein